MSGSRSARAAATAALIGVAVGMASPSGWAQGPGDVAKARDLAVQGRIAFDRGDLATGCPLLAQAYQLDGQLLGAGFALAECREKEGRLVTAHGIFLEIADKAAARKEARADEARTRAASLETRFSRLKVDVAERASQRTDLVVEVDGKAWPKASWGAPVAIDGGPHEVTARAEGVPPWSTQVEIANEGANVEVSVPFDRDQAATPAPTPADTTEPEDDGATFPWKTGGLVTGGVGVAMLGAGVVVGLVAKGDYDSVEGECDASNACTPGAAATRDDARGLAGVGTVFFIGGAVLAAAGVTVFLLAPDESSETAALRVAPGSVELAGRF
jgi:hypothetical protein